jgi:hypothetical protein
MRFRRDRARRERDAGQENRIDAPDTDQNDCRDASRHQLTGFSSSFDHRHLVTSSRISPRDASADGLSSDASLTLCSSSLLQKRERTGFKLVATEIEG